MARKKLTQAAIKFLQDNPEVAEQLGKVGQTVLRTIKGTEKVVKPTTVKPATPKLTAGQKAKVRLYVDSKGKKYTSIRKGLEDIEAGTAIPKSAWSQMGKEERVQVTGTKKVSKPKTGSRRFVTGSIPAYAKDIRSKKEKAKALREQIKSLKEKEEELAKRVDIELSTALEGSKAFKEDMKKVVTILGNETPNMRNLRQAGEKTRGGITGLLKSMEGPAVSSPYAPGGKFYRPPATHALPSQRIPDVATGALKEEGRSLEDDVIEALNLPIKDRDKRLRELELFYGRKKRAVTDPETKQKLGDQIVSEIKVRGDVPLTGIIGGRDITGRPLSQHAIEMSPKERDFIMSTIGARVPGLTKQQRQRITKDLWYKGESKLPKGYIDKQTGDDVIQWRIHPEQESRYPIETPGINQPFWNEAKQRWENLTSQTRYRQERPAYPKGVVAEEMGLRGDPGIKINPESIQGAAGQKAAVTRPQVLEYRPEAAYIPPYLKRGVPKFPAQRGSIDLPMAQRAEQTGALTQPLDVTQQRILKNLRRSRRSEKLSRLGEEETIRQAGIQARTGVRKDPTLRTFDPTEPLPSTETIKKVGRKKQTFVDYPTTPAPKVTAKQRATEKAKEKINREVVVIRAKKVEFNKLVANGFETPQSLAKRKDYKAWDRKRKALKKTINKKYPEWQEYISDAGGVKVWQGKYVDSFKKGDIITRRSGGQLNKPRGWGIARYRG